MTGWERRAADAFGASNIHVWKTPDQRVAYVCESDLCAFLRVKPVTLRRWIGAALTWHNALPDAYTLAVDTEGVLYRWQALEAILGVPALVTKCHRVKMSGIMKGIYEKEDDSGYEYRHETPIERRARLDAENVLIKRHAATVHRTMERDRKQRPEQYAALFASMDNVFAAHANLFTDPTWHSPRVPYTTTKEIALHGRH